MFLVSLKSTMHMQPFLFKMASATSVSNRQFLTVDEVLQGVFANADSAEEKIESETETEPSSPEEVDESDLTLPKANQNYAPKRGPRIRGSLSRANLNQIKAAEKEVEREALENKWKRKDSKPHISNFTSISTINAELPDDPPLDLYLDEGFYKYFTLQTNLYAAQHLQSNSNLPLHSRFQKLKDVSNNLLTFAS